MPPLILVIIILLAIIVYIIVPMPEYQPPVVQSSSTVSTRKEQDLIRIHAPSEGSNPKSSVSSRREDLLIWNTLQFLYNIRQHERRVYSQDNEDGVIEYLFDNMGTTNKRYVEFGTQSCSECNTRWLWEEYGWDGLLIDGNGKTGDSRIIRNHYITEDNIVGLFQKYDAPKEMDLLSVDIDSQDFYVLDAILRGGYRPRVVVVEINRSFGLNESYTIDRSVLVWKGDSAFGMSPLAANRLCNKYNYHGVYLQANGVNLYCVSRKAMSDLVFSKTNIRIEPNELREYLPQFSYWWHKTEAIHTDSLIKFRKEFLSLPCWMVVNEAGEAVNRTIGM
ncbi:hypothetical protein SmJEL517_g03551 [Synchytrium microbalum]|uniref:Methyltransferase FkbM domain-containing protein n=1 Tax=Synchytrium microbalum TaxID=1806994 RepID=A0A507C2N1_9FUNG|nr:uncharacterized protein SmJEL517_g03551 [Synchytrium microbalum]TPX33618.1 hypothetical protein SmJEL517_g03551 [Synchytrium microbalum]